jgi:hypothetical protein
MFKVAYLHGQEIAREEAIEPIVNNKYNTIELSNFYNRISNQIHQEYNNNKEIEFYVRYQ